MTFNPLEFEPEILEFWKAEKIHEKANKANEGNKKFYFCDGPPYTSGKVHIGTAWNKSYKDSILRYKRMQGFHVLDRAGYDMHGLPTENATEKKLGIKGKAEIEKFGVGNFTKECKKLSIHNMKVMNKDFQRLGVWMDFEHAYQSVSRDFISGEWWLVKTAHEKGRLYEGHRSMAWDWADQSAVAKHELEYKVVKDVSIYVKMPVKGKENEHFIIWTTTPWTIAFNMGIMVNPKVAYVKAKVGDEQWIVAKDLADDMIKTRAKHETYEVVQEYLGEELKGIEYVHPFHEDLKHHYEEIKKNHSAMHTVVLSEEYVDTSQGTGLVHMAAGCGPQDYEVGHRNGLPAWNLVKENGQYDDTMGPFSGMHAHKDNIEFIKEIHKRNALVAKLKVEHDYPHGERSHQPVIFRATKQWFFKVEDLKEKLISENDQVHWVPKAGYNAFNSWLHNLRDNSISKQRYWGTPVPIWRNTDDESDIIVVGSVDELEALAGVKVEEPHIPFIDEVEIKKDGKTYKRVPDILDVWVDAGTASWNSLNFPRNKEAFDRYFPMDFILEGKDQVRGWFNLLHIASILGFDKACFKAVFMHAYVQDAQGRKMSKSLGNYITPDEVVDKWGADVLRYYLIGGANAGVDINYNFDDLKAKYGNLMVLWNLHNYLLDLAKNNNFSISDIDLEKELLNREEQYIFSKLHSTIRKMTELYDDYRLDEPPMYVEQLFLELSRTYVHLTRDKATSGSNEDKKVVLYTLYTVLMDVLRIFSPMAPFITEKIYQNLKSAFDLKEESVHFLGWPKYDEAYINKELENQMDVMHSLVQSVLACREKMKRGVRWPVQELVVVTSDEKTISAIEAVKKLVKTQVNVKEIDIQPSLPGVKQTVQPDAKQLGPDFGANSPKIIAKLVTESPETILSHIDKDGKYVLSIDGEEFTIVSEHLIVKREVPEEFVEGSFKGGMVYVNREVDDTLEAEGYAREVMRRVQVARKKAGLEKKDAITLHIEAADELVSMLSTWTDDIKDKVGAEFIKIDHVPPAKEMSVHSKEKVKDHEFSVHFDC